MDTKTSVLKLTVFRPNFTFSFHSSSYTLNFLEENKPLGCHGSVVYLCTLSIIMSFMHSVMHSFCHSCIQSCIHSVIHAFSYSSILSFMPDGVFSLKEVAYI